MARAVVLRLGIKIHRHLKVVLILSYEEEGIGIENHRKGDVKKYRARIEC